MTAPKTACPGAGGDNATGFMVFDASDRLMEVDPGLLGRDGQDAAALVGLPLHEAVACVLRRFAKVGGTVVDAGSGDAGDAVEQWLEAGTAPVAAETRDGRAALLTARRLPDGTTLLSSVDVTAVRAPADTILGGDEELFRCITECHPLPVWMADMETGEILYQSDGATRFLGEANDRGRPRSIYDFCVEPCGRDEVIRRLADGGGFIEDHEVQLRHDDGTSFWISATVRAGTYRGRKVMIAGVLDLTERKNKEAELEQARSMLRDAIESLSEGFALYDQDARLVMCNASYRAFHARNADLLKPGVTWHDLMRGAIARGQYPDAVGREDEWIEEHDAMRRQFGRRHEYETAEGRWMDSVSTETSQGGFVITRSDITERKKLEQSTQQREEQLRFVIENHPLPVTLTDEETGDIIYESPEGARLFGREWGQAAGTRITDLYVDPREREALMEVLRAKGEVRDVEVRLKRVDGAPFSALLNARLAEYRGRGVVLAGLTDQTERIAREQEIFQARELLCDAIESLAEGFALYDADDRLVMCNARYREMHSMLDDVLVPGVRWLDLLRAGAERGQFPGAVGRIDAWIEERRADRARYRQANEIEHANGRCYSVSNSRTRHGGTVVTRVDITERKQMDAKLAEQREALFQREKLSALGELLAGVAHELNNPLSIVVGQAQLLHEDATEPRIVERAGKIGNAADRCARIVKTFLAMARQQPGELTRVDLNTVVETSLEVASYALRSSGVQVKLKLQAGLPCTAADGDQLNQVLINLLVNAQQALEGVEGDRKVTVSTYHSIERHEVVLKVSDNGCGIEPGLQMRIFEPFFTTKEVGAGTGIGLAFCHRIVERHGGTIAVASAPGRGTVFTVRLPIRAAAVSCRETGPCRPPQRLGQAVLVIDDEPGVAELIAEILDGDGHAVTVCGSAQAGLEHIRTGMFDAVLSDLRMPEMDGPDLFERLKLVAPEVVSRLAFVTGDTMSPQARNFLASSGRPYVEKPIRPQELRELLETLAAGP